MLQHLIVLCGCVLLVTSAQHPTFKYTEARPTTDFNPFSDDSDLDRLESAQFRYSDLGRFGFGGLGNFGKGFGSAFGRGGFGNLGKGLGRSFGNLGSLGGLGGLGGLGLGGYGGLNGYGLGGRNLGLGRLF
ncbi:hypothetical protein Bhyg_09282 [Pseudolycoriella hygida]|uniref:Uncharacterized protein n=1 Tax=Pseudolycoriella hygida TaxID=35572 RepID=A0A9Q0N6H0_9DIPT|nr:hypothetical protein Bhyg_09282 [Pseudolycoriella hygida]